MFFFLRRAIPTTTRSAPSQGGLPSSAVFPARATGLRFLLSPIGATLLWLLALGLSSNALAQNYDPNGITVAGGNGEGAGANQLNFPAGVFVDGSGNVYVADYSNHRIQKWAPGVTSGTTVAGGNGYGSGANQLSFPLGVFVDGSGNVYVADLNNHRIQKWAPGATSGTTVAGGNGRNSGANQLADPSGVFVDGSGNVYVADFGNHRIQKWAPGATEGITVAGGNGRGAGANQLSFPAGVFVDGSGNVYVADQNNNRIQRWVPGATSGTTVAGGNGYGSGANQLAAPRGLSVDGSGNVYVADQNNHRIQKFSPLVAPLLTGLSASPNPVCAGQPVQFTATVGNVSGTYNYALTNGASSTIQGTASDPAFSQSLTAGGSGSQTYTLTITTEGGSTEATVSVTVNALPTPAITGLSASYCKDAGAVTLSGTPAGGSFTIDGQSATQLDPASLSAGSHIIRYTVTNSENGCSAFTEQTIEIKPLPDATFSGLSGPYCADAAAVTLSPTTAGGSFTGPGVSGTTFTPANAGSGGIITYALTIDGCTNTSSQSVTVNALPTVEADPDQSVVLGFGSNCASLTATASGGSGEGYRFSWDPGNLVGPAVTVCPQQTTTYEVTLTDGNGCKAKDQVKVNVFDVRCGNKNQYVTICYYGVTQCVSEKIAQRYLKIGATLGGCGSSAARISYGEQASELFFNLSLKAFPNPVQDAVTVEVLSPTAGPGTFEVLDVTGRVRQSRTEQLAEGLNEVKFRLGGLPTGVYLIKYVDALNRQGVVKVSKE